MSTQRYRTEFKKILEETILPEGLSSEEQKERLQSLSNHILAHMPQTIFRYRECSEMNFDAFNEDKLYAVTADKFNDPYDCLFRYDKESFCRSVMTGMSKEVMYFLRDLFRQGGDFPDGLANFYNQDFLERIKENIVNANDSMIEKYGEEIESIKDSFCKDLYMQTEDVARMVQQLPFITCFSEVIDSVTMWSHYANSHKGFALEYDTKDFQLRCLSCSEREQCDKAIICNLFPIIYQPRRYDATNFLAYYIGKSMGLPIKNPDTFVSSKVLLYKSSQWKYEKEWRLVVNKQNNYQDKSPVCIYQLKPKAIYYGSRISPIHKKLLHLMAKEKGIKEYQMCIDHKSYKYSIKAQKM